MGERNEEARKALEVKQANIRKQEQALGQNKFMIKDLERQIGHNKKLIPIWNKKYEILKSLTYSTNQPKNPLEESPDYCQTIKDEQLLNLEMNIEQANINIPENERKIQELKAQNERIEVYLVALKTAGKQ